jgi:hypothetical protein
MGPQDEKEGPRAGIRIVKNKRLFPKETKMMTSQAVEQMRVEIAQALKALQAEASTAYSIGPAPTSDEEDRMLCRVEEIKASVAQLVAAEAELAQQRLNGSLEQWVGQLAACKTSEELQRLADQVQAEELAKALVAIHQG